MDWETLAKMIEAQAKKLAALAGQLTTKEEDDQVAANAIFLEVYEARCSLARASALARVAALAAEKEARDE